MTARPGKSKRGTPRAEITKSTSFNPVAIDKAGRRIYDRQRAAFERHHHGQYVLIDIRTERVFIGESPEAAYHQATAEQSEGPFYLVRVGQRAAFRSRRQPNGDAARIAR